MSKLDDIRAKRAERDAALAKAQDDQRATDLEAIFAIEEKLGATNVTVLEIPFTPGLPILVAARTPSDGEIKRYRARLRASMRDNGKIDHVPATEEIAAACRVYPSDEVYESVLAARAGVHVQLGSAAVALAGGKAAEEGKD